MQLDCVCSVQVVLSLIHNSSLLRDFTGSATGAAVITLRSPKADVYTDKHFKGFLLEIRKGHHNLIICLAFQDGYVLGIFPFNPTYMRHVFVCMYVCYNILSLSGVNPELEAKQQGRDCGKLAKKHNHLYLRSWIMKSSLLPTLAFQSPVK